MALRQTGSAVPVRNRAIFTSHNLDYTRDTMDQPACEFRTSRYMQRRWNA